MRTLLAILATVSACALIAEPLAAQRSARPDSYETVLSRAASRRATNAALPKTRVVLVPERGADHTLTGGIVGAIVGGVGFAVYIDQRCQRHRSDAGCGASVTLAAVEGAVVGAFVGAIVGQRM